MTESEPIRWIDKSVFSTERIVLTEQELGIPGLKTFGYHHEKQEYHALPNHYHPGCFEFTYLSSGSAIFSVKGNNYYLFPGDIMITPPGIVHSTNHVALALHSMYWFQIDVRNPNNFLHLSVTKAIEIIKRLKSFGTTVITLSPSYADKKLNQIFHNFCTATQNPKDLANFELLSFILTVFQQATDDSNTLEQSPDILKTIHYISVHIKETIKLDFLASIADLSESRFKQKFSDQIGMSPRVYINYEKVKKAKTFLLEGHNVIETAMEFNFSSSNYFCVVFKRYLGISPTKFVKSEK